MLSRMCAGRQMGISLRARDWVVRPWMRDGRGCQAPCQREMWGDADGMRLTATDAATATATDTATEAATEAVAVSAAAICLLPLRYKTTVFSVNETGCPSVYPYERDDHKPFHLTSFLAAPSEPPPRRGGLFIRPVL